MGWFTPSSWVSKEVAVELESLAKSGDSQATAVADCLNTIASNADRDDHECSTAEYLAGCAEIIAEHALGFSNKFSGESPKKLLSRDQVRDAVIAVLSSGMFDNEAQGHASEIADRLGL